VMDYNYNMLAGLEKDAILITNGDNDTFPGWILMRLLNFRSDVIIANRSLLNTEWYPGLLVNEGAPKFITQSGLESLRSEINAQKTPIPPQGLYGDTLIVKLIEAAQREERPVYFAATLYSSEMVERYRSKGRDLGLVTLVTPPKQSCRIQLRKLLDVWLNEFRTAGMNSWKLRYAEPSCAGRMLMMNYAAGIYTMMDSIRKYTPEYRVNLFRWYLQHIEPLIPEKMKDKMNEMWNRQNDVEEIKNWCRSQGYTE